MKDEDKERIKAILMDNDPDLDVNSSDEVSHTHTYKPTIIIAALHKGIRQDVCMFFVVHTTTVPIDHELGNVLWF